jgi:hypothetical protein
MGQAYRRYLTYRKYPKNNPNLKCFFDVKGRSKNEKPA